MSRHNIGMAGEQIFDRWARSAGCVSTRPESDVIGVDRLFEIPLDHRDITQLDTAPPASHGWVQIKTTRRARNDEQVKLDICRRFVFADTPSFFLRIRIDEEEAPLQAYLLHVDETCGAAILAALRRVGADGPEAAAMVHRNRFTVRWGEEHRVQADGRHVMARLAELIGDPVTYAARKRAWRESVGYGHAPTRITLRVSPESMARHLLGDAPSLTATVSEATTRRFDVARPIEGLIGPAREVRIGITNGDAALLRVKSGTRWVDVPGRFWSPLAALRHVPDGLDAWRFEGGLLAMRGREQLVTVQVGLGEARRACLSEWRASADACAVMAGPTEWSVLLIMGERPIQLAVGTSAFGRRRLPAIGLVRTALRFAVEAGLPESIEVSSDELVEHHDERQLCVDLQCDRELTLDYPIAPSVLAQMPAAAPLAVTATCWARLGRWYTVSSVTSEPVPWTTKGIRKKRVVVRAPICRRTPFKVTERPREALDLLRSLDADAHALYNIEGVMHLIFTDDSELRLLAEAGEATETGAVE